MKTYAFRFICGFCLLACAGIARGQSVLESDPATPMIPAALRDAARSSPFALPGAPGGNSSPLHWGPIDLKPHLSDKFIYSDGIQATPGHPANSYINTLSAGLLADIGSYWTIDYTPTWTIYTNKTFQNAVDHSLNLAGGREFGDWMLQFTQAYSSTNTPRVDTGRQTGEQTSATNFQVSRQFNDHWSLNLGVAQNLQFIEASPDNYDWSTNDRLVYRYRTGFELSLGCQLGLTDFDPGAYMTYVNPTVQTRWRVGDKLTMSLQGGREHRQVHKRGFAAQNTPTWNATAQYQPFEHTSLSLSANRSVSPSYLSNSVSDGQGWTAEFNQRLLGQLNFSASTSHQKTHFSGSHLEFVPSFAQQPVLDDSGNVVGTVTTVTFTPNTVLDLRNDSTSTLDLRLSTPIMKRGTFTVLYNRSTNSSSAAGFGFTSHQVGCEVGYRW